MTYKLYILDNQFIIEQYHGLLPRNFTGIIETSVKSKEWYIKGKLHRLDGPAIEYADGSKEWFIVDKRVTEEEYNLLFDIMRLKGLL